MEIAVDIKAAEVLTQIAEDSIYRLNVNQWHSLRILKIRFAL